MVWPDMTSPKIHRRISLEKRRHGRNLDKTTAMNQKDTRQQHKHGSTHGAFKHVAEPATLGVVLNAFGLKMSEYQHTKEAVLNKTRPLAHAR
jgi:hypothetical protein